MLSQKIKRFFQGMDAEVTTQSLFDSVRCSELQLGGVQHFFCYPIGIEGKTEADTNMVGHGALPNNQAFMIEEIAAELHGCTLARDRAKFFSKTGIRLEIGNKLYLVESPVSQEKETPKISIAFQDAAGGIKITAFQGEQSTPFVLTPNNLLLTAHQPFRVTLFNIARPKNGRIFVRLRGQLMRAIQ